MPSQYASYGPARVDKALGALPVIAAFCRRLDIAGIIDRACPIREVAIATHGQVIEALIANRLTSPTPLVHVQDWASTFAVPEVFDLSADTLNDDRVGRALDAVAPELGGIIGSIGLGAIAAFGVDVSRIHWDMTSISLCGAYLDPEDGFAQPRWGHPKDRRRDLKQIQTGFGVTADGALPIFHRVFDGGAGEVAQVVPAMEALRRVAGERRFLMVGDSKLVSYDNLAALVEANVTFIAPAAKTYVPTTVLAGCDLAGTTPVDYVAERDHGKGPTERGTWRVSEDTMTLAGKRKSDPVLALRRVFVYSSARAGAARVARDKKLDRARDDLGRLARGLGGRHYPTEKEVHERILAITRARRVTPYLISRVGTSPAGKPTLSWSFDQVALDADAAADGWYALLTNLNPTQAEAAAVLLRYKGQETVERRNRNFKGSLAVAPMFLKNNRRIEALISVICLALLIFSLVERAVRLALNPTAKFPGLWAGRAAKPTVQLVFTALSSLRLVPATDTAPAQIPQPLPLQARLLQLLGVDPRQARY